jgi:ABC-type multidrug transport system ATPase subunit
MMHPHRNIAIKAEALIKTYTVKDTKMNALNGVNLKIYQSQIFGLLGRNGAGKTTLVDILTGVVKPTLGAFQIAANSSIGICYQHEILYETLTVAQHLDFYSRIKVYELPIGETRQTHIDEIIRTLGIEGER